MSVLTDEDLTVIEDLDFEPGCELDCDSRADAHVTERMKICGCTNEALLCQSHVDLLIEYTDDFAIWKCEGCATEFGYGNGQVFIAFDIKPLR